MRPCQQSKCVLLGSPLCPQCSECGSPSSMVDENCVTCHNCEYDNGAVRGVIRKPNQGDIRVMVKEVE